MTNLKIKDPSELANLYKRIGYEKFDRLVNIIRQSQVMIDVDSKDEFILSLIYDFDQKKLDDLIYHFNSVYGLQPATMRSLILTNYREYVTGEEIIAHAKLPADNSFYLEAKKRLVQPIYDRREFEKIVHSIDDRAVITARLSKKLGYLERGNSGMLVQERFSSAINAINDLFYSNDIFDTINAPSIESRLIKYKIYEAELNHDLVKISDTKYMTGKYLASKGISKNILEEFIASVTSYIEADTFFTFKSLVDSGFSHSLFELGFDSVFYERLIFTSKKIRMVKTTGNVFIMPQKTTDYQPSLVEFISFIMKDNDSIELEELQSLMWDTYGIRISREKIIDKINNSNLFYSTELNSIYVSRQVMLDSIYG